MGKSSPKIHPHSAKIAALFGLIIPGAGQAYNGRLFRGAFVLLTAPLLLPWIIGIVTGAQQAKSINQGGGRTGFGGRMGLFFHLWFAVNVSLFVLLGLSMSGMLT